MAIDLTQAKSLLADITTSLNQVSQNVTALQAATQASDSAADQAQVNDLTSQIATVKQQVDALQTASTLQPATPAQPQS